MPPPPTGAITAPPRIGVPGALRLAALLRLAGAGVLALLCAACNGTGEDSWRGYMYDDLISTTTRQTFGPFDSLALCRGTMLSRVAAAGPHAGYACAQGCPAPVGGLISDCEQVKL